MRCSLVRSMMNIGRVFKYRGVRRSHTVWRKSMASSEGTKKKNKSEKNSGAESTAVETTDETFTFFFGAESPFSQWHSAVFKVDGEEYNCAEQYMMHQKADAAMAAKIMASDDPREQKALGRKVSNFSEKTWKENCREIVKKGNLAKFSQNADLKAEMMKTKGTTLVEAAPRDTVWGIGLSAKNWKAQQRRHWRGKNLLGQILTEVREELATSK